MDSLLGASAQLGEHPHPHVAGCDASEQAMVQPLQGRTGSACSSSRSPTRPRDVRMPGRGSSTFTQGSIGASRPVLMMTLRQLR